MLGTDSSHSMSSAKVFVVAHLYAAIWTTTHAVILLTISLVLLREWMKCALLCVLLIYLAHIQYPKSQTIIDIFLPVICECCGGAEILRNDLRTDVPKLYCIHPHGVVANGLGIAMSDCVRRGERPVVAVASILFWLNPLFRWFVNSMGCDLTAVTQRNLEAAMVDRRQIALIPGGFEDVMLMHPGNDVVFLSKRKGFIRLAMKHGYAVVPVFCFGESLLFRNALRLPENACRSLAKAHLPVVIPRGESWWSLLPSAPPKGIRVVFDEPLMMPKNVNPTNSDIDKAHAEYLQKLRLIHRTFNHYTAITLEIL